jgi:phenylacetate-CoA ligase
VLEYLDDDEGVLQRLAEGLRVGGVLLLSVPNRSSAMGAMQDLIARCQGLNQLVSGTWWAYSKRTYGIAAFRDSLQQAMLEPLRTTFFELPNLGRLGVPLSRMSWLGTMMLVTATKRQVVRSGATRVATSRWRRVRSLSLRNLWEAAPDSLRLLTGSLVGHWALGPRFWRTSRRLKEWQHWGSERTHQCQLQELRRLLRCADRSPYYRGIFQQVGLNPRDFHSPKELTRLPLLDKRIIAQYSVEILGTARLRWRMDTVSTSGADGTPLEFPINLGRSSTEYAYLVTSWERAGFTLGTTMAVLRGRVVKADRQGLRHEYDPLLRHHYYSAFHLTDENMGRYLEHISTIGPCFLHVYPSSVSALARFCRRSAQRPPGNIRGIIAESEIVYPEQRKMVEEVFGCRYFSDYGQTEKVVLAAECEHSTDYHVWPTYGYFELVDELGNPVTTPGQRGEIVGTGFINTVMPFIRYRTGDFATYVGERCEACGREHPIIRDIRGHRTQEVLVAGDGSEIPWVALNMHDDTFDRVRQFQFRQDEPGKAVLKVVPAKGFDDACCRRIQQNLGRKLDGRLDFTIDLVESIPLSARGKAIYVDQRISSSAGEGRGRALP